MILNKGNAFDKIKMDVQPLPSNLLTDRFVVPPFSVFDTRQGYWSERKRQWKNLGIKSEIGRGDNLTYNMGSFNYDDEKERQEELKNNKFGKCLPGFDMDEYRIQNKENSDKSVYGKCLPDSIGEKYGRKNVQATSIFDPVLTEISYQWFSRKGDKVIDPFAGGSVRGVIAACLGRNYTGIDLSAPQIKANREQYEDITSRYLGIEGTANWVHGDSMFCKELAPNKYQFLLTCPPYYDLEVYSEEEGDLSNLDTYDEFMEMFEKIIKNATYMLEEDSFAVCVVGDVRDKRTGEYYDFPGDTVRAFKKAGLKYYNEGILVNVTGTLPVRISKQFNSGRKLGKQHQNVLVFYKGNTDNIKEKFGEFLLERI